MEQPARGAGAGSPGQESAELAALAVTGDSAQCGELPIDKSVMNAVTEVSNVDVGLSTESKLNISVTEASAEESTSEAVGETPASNSETGKTTTEKSDGDRDMSTGAEESADNHATSTGPGTPAENGETKTASAPSVENSETLTPSQMPSEKNEAEAQREPPVALNGKCSVAAEQAAPNGRPPLLEEPGACAEASSDAAAGDRKAPASPRRPHAQPHPHRVSFSEGPPQRAVYDNLAFVGDKGSDPELPRKAELAAAAGPDLPPGERWRILRNVSLVSTAFMLLFTAFFGAANLQSSVNAEAGLGTVSLTAVYAAIIVSNLFLPSIVIRWLGCKWTVAAGMLLFTPYAAAQLSASWSSLVPTALLLGAAGAPMWCAKCTYLNMAAAAYSRLTGSPADLIMVRFFGIFYVLFPLGHVWGNLITSEVLSGEEPGADNSTLALDVSAVCGPSFCPAARSAEANPNLARPPEHLIRTIGALFIALSLIAALLVALAVDGLERYGEQRRGDPAGLGSGPGPGPAGLLVATLRLLGDRNQLMLVPVTAFIGISQAFLGADFTEAYIACAWGIRHIGYVLVGYGLASALASVLVSWAVKRAGRLPVVLASIALFLALVAVLRWWRPAPGQGAAFVLLTAAWGFADSTALVINAMYGLLFRGREAAAYSNFSLWGSAGFIATYSYSPHLCMGTKLAVLAAVLLLAAAGFTGAELALRRSLRLEKAAAVTAAAAATGKPPPDPAAAAATAGAHAA